MTMPRAAKYKEVDIRLSEWCEQVREPDGDGWDRGDEECQYGGVKVFLPVPKENRYGFERHEVRGGVKAGDHVFVVVERFAEGSTFGRTTGRSRIVRVTKTRKAAEKVTKDPKNQYVDYFGGHEDWIIEEEIVNP